MRKIEIKKGDRYGRIEVLQETEPSITPGGTIRRRFLCECSCGKIWSVAMTELKNGDTKSCGCLRLDRNRERLTKHGGCRTKTYQAWCNMKYRCTNKNSKDYINYGGRGIKVDKKWFNSYESFLSDMGESPVGMTIDRINNNKGYYKENCKWKTRKEQNNNKRSNKIIMVKGKKKSFSSLAKELGLSYTTLYMRFYKGWSIERILTTNLKIN